MICLTSFLLQRNACGATGSYVRYFTLYARFFYTVFGGTILVLYRTKYLHTRHDPKIKSWVDHFFVVDTSKIRYVGFVCFLYEKRYFFLALPIDTATISPHLVEGGMDSTLNIGAWMKELGGGVGQLSISVGATMVGASKQRGSGTAKRPSRSSMRVRQRFLRGKSCTGATYYEPMCMQFVAHRALFNPFYH